MSIRENIRNQRFSQTWNRDIRNDRSSLAVSFRLFFVGFFFSRNVWNETEESRENGKEKGNRGRTYPVEVNNESHRWDRARINRYSSRLCLVTGNFDLPFRMRRKRRKVEGSDTRTVRSEFEAASSNRYSPKPSFQAFEIPLRLAVARRRESIFKFVMETPGCNYGTRSSTVKAVEFSPFPPSDLYRPPTSFNFCFGFLRSVSLRCIAWRYEPRVKINNFAFSGISGKGGKGKNKRK